MAPAPYNTWYDSTYEAIFDMATWTVFHADVAKKVACIFAWMPQTIMGVKGRARIPKWASYSHREVCEVLESVSPQFTPLQKLSLLSTAIADIEGGLRPALEATFPLFGSVAASKYLHFSAPQLIPMWDRSIRLSRKHLDSADGFIEYIRLFQAELREPDNLQEARTAYPANPVRGWDIRNMRGRDA
jgi:hypothetical protein